MASAADGALNLNDLRIASKNSYAWLWRLISPIQSEPLGDEAL